MDDFHGVVFAVDDILNFVHGRESAFSKGGKEFEVGREVGVASRPARAAGARAGLGAGPKAEDGFFFLFKQKEAHGSNSERSELSFLVVRCSTVCGTVCSISTVARCQ